MDDNRILILDAMEINLLGKREWNGMPPLESDVPLEQRMVDAFVHLCNLGMLTPRDDGWERSPLLHELFDPVAEPDTTLLLSQIGPQVCLYRQGDHCTLFSQLLMQPESCRVLSMNIKETAAYLRAHLDEYAAFLEPDEKTSEAPCTLQMLDGSGALLRIFWLRKDGDTLLANEAIEADESDELKAADSIAVTGAWLEALVMEEKP